MNALEDFIIQRPYLKTNEDEDLINQASPGVNHHRDWEKKCLSPFKERARDHYRIQQNRRCAYCRTIIKSSQSSPEVEHIVHKSSRSDWMYETFNLCVSCKSCNTKKHTKNVLRNKHVINLPHKSTSYLIVHPHIDQYSSHIEIVDDILYKGLTTKGRNTIQICGLDRYELAADRAEEKIKTEGHEYERVILELISRMRKPLVNVLDKFEERIHEICEEYKMMGY